MGINVYRPGWYVEPSNEPPGYREIPINASHPKPKNEWLVFDPEVMYWAPRQMQSISGAKSIYITENGCAASDVVAEDGRVYDSDRVMFLRAYLGQLQRATSEGVPVDGYFLWSAQDNFEWIYGHALCSDRSGGRPPQARPQISVATSTTDRALRPQRSSSRLLEPAHDHSAASA